ncbi:unnamed protein product, partial [Rotaria sp. Silwood2]
MSSTRAGTKPKSKPFVRQSSSSFDSTRRE